MYWTSTTTMNATIWTPMLVEGSILGWVALVASFGFAFVAVAVAGEDVAIPFPFAFLQVEVFVLLQLHFFVM
jgi:hypothetical protein